MCSRFWGVGGERIRTAFEIKKELGATLDTYYRSPRDMVVAVYEAAGERALDQFCWGFTVPTSTQPVLHARVETVLTKPLFANAVRQRRCLVPAMGYFEWRQEGKRKQPYFFRRHDEEPIAFAGIWRLYQDMRELCIITGEPNELVRNYHNRMPVILPSERYEAWLSPGDPTDCIGEALTPYPAALMECYPVDTAVAQFSFQTPQAIEPLRNLFDFE